MSVVSRKQALGLAAVLDIAIHSRSRLVPAKELAKRLALPPRHLEPLLQQLVHDGILKGVRGPRGGYKLARGSDRIVAEEIARSAGRDDSESEEPIGSSEIPDLVVRPALTVAESTYFAALRDVTVAELVGRAESCGTIGEAADLNRVDNA